MEISFKILPKEAGEVILVMPYGSHLYGTNTPSSDKDYKAIYIPHINNILLGKKLTNFKDRYRANGTVITDDSAAMESEGVEIEFIAIQTFLQDYFAGQTYAMEMAYGIQQNKWEMADVKRINILTLVDRLIASYQTNNTASMVGFATKQTFDYVHRGERLNEALFFLGVLNKIEKEVVDYYEKNPRADGVKMAPKHIRLDTQYGDKIAFDEIRKLVEASEKYAPGIKVEPILNGPKQTRSFAFAGRNYVQESPFYELTKQVQARIDKYGTRSTAAAKSDIDPKSMMHAVRVYQQVLELLRTGQITFPRPNRDELLSIKDLSFGVDNCVKLLKELDVEVMDAVEKYPQRTKELQKYFNDLLLETLRGIYV